MTVVGELALWVALFLAVWGSVAAFGGAVVKRPELVTSSVRSIVACAGMTAVASLGLLAALVGHDFSLQYVAAHTTLNTPTLYLITALWAGPPGAMLSLGLSLSVSSVVVASTCRGRGGELPWIAGALAAVLAVVLASICFVANPFDGVEWAPSEGQGLDPRLQTPLAAPYYVATYAAYGTAAGAFACAIGTSLARDSQAEQLASVRRWALVTWVLLSISVALGMRSTYLDPLEGGFWRRDLAELSTVGGWVLALVLLRALAARTRSTSHRSLPMLASYIGAGILVAGLAAQRSWTTASIALGPGEATEAADPYGRRWRFVSQGVSRDEGMNHLATGVALEAWRGGESVAIVSAERRQYLDSFQRPIHAPVQKPGVESSLRQDVYVTLDEVRGESARLRVSFRPLVALVWIGWVLIGAGGFALGAGRSGRPVRRDGTLSSTTT